MIILSTKFPPKIINDSQQNESTFEVTNVSSSNKSHKQSTYQRVFGAESGKVNFQITDKATNVSHENTIKESNDVNWNSTKPLNNSIPKNASLETSSTERKAGRKGKLKSRLLRINTNLGCVIFF